MGIWSSIGNAFSSACSAVTSAISSVVGAVSNTFSSVISSVATLAPQISGVLNALSVVIPKIRAIATILDVAFKVLGLLKPDESTEDLGNKALQAQEAGIKPADFSSYEEYMKEIRAFKLDPEKTYSTEEKIAAGVSVQAWGMEETFGEGSSEFLTIIMKDAQNENQFFTAERVDAILKGIDSVSEIVSYFKNELSPDEQQTVEKQIVEIEQSLSPDKSMQEIYDELDKQIEIQS